MKKVFAIVITIISIVFAITATAESIDLLLAGDNARIAGVLNPSEFRDFDPVEAAHATIPGGLGGTGCVLREKSVLSADTSALSRVTVDDFTVVNMDLLKQVGYVDPVAITPAGLLADTIECDGVIQSHRMVGMSKVSKETLAAEITVDGRLVYVLVYDWGDDGNKNLCLVAGSSSDMNYRKNTKSSTGGTTNESTGSPEPDPHYRNWGAESDSSETSASTGTPDPHYRNF